LDVPAERLLFVKDYASGHLERDSIEQAKRETEMVRIVLPARKAA